jgi:ABC-type branched-subunit amino acid transport system ATPase component/ABC-type branched-subunit amino acid transport system permease subunit
VLAQPRLILPGAERPLKIDLRTLRRSAALITCLVLFLIVPWNLDETWALELGLAAIYAIIGISLNIVVGYLGQVSLGQQALVAMGGFTAANLVGAHGWPFGLGMVAGVVVGGFVAAFLGLFALRIRGLYLALVTLIFGIAAQASLFQIPSIAGGVLGLPLYRPSYLTHNYYFYVLALALLILVYLLDMRLVGSKVGRALIAIRHDRNVAATIGVDITSYSILAFALSGSIAGLAGALWAGWEQSINASDFGYQMGLLFLMMVVLGGGSRASVAITSAFFAVFTFMLEQFQPLVLRVGTSQLALFLPVFGGVMVVLALLNQEREAARRRSRGGARGSGAMGTSDGDRSAALAAFEHFSRAVGAELPNRRRSIESVLSVSNLSVAFGGLQAINDVSFEIKAGEIVGLVGPNGAGKTTCFNCVTGLQGKWLGGIRFKGKSLAKVPAHRRAELGIGRTFQQIGLLKEESVLLNVMAAQHAHLKCSAVESLLPSPRAFGEEAKLRRSSRQLLDAMDMGHLGGTRVDTLPYGTMRLIELLCVLAMRPDLLLLDEPSSGMSQTEGEHLVVLLKQVHARLGLSILIIEHHVPLVVDLCDRIHVLESGVIIASGSPSDIQHDPVVVAAFLGKGA